MPSSEVSRRRRARLVTATLAWALAVCAATAIGLTAVGAIGDGIIGAGQRPLTPPEVQARLVAAAAAARPAPPVPAGEVSLLAGAASEALTSPGGAVLARCRGRVVEVVSAAPAQGFRVHEQDEDDRDEVEFESDDITVKVRLSCPGDRPVAQIKIDD